MNDLIHEHQELELSRRFDRGECIPRNEVETSVFASYRQIRNGLSQHRIPAIEPHILAHRLAVEINSEDSFCTSHTWIFSLQRKTAWCIPAATILLFIYLFSSSKQSVFPNPVTQVEFSIPISPGKQTVPREWEMQLQKGEFVQVPYTVESSLLLRDGSKLTCIPGTEFSVHYDRNRTIKLVRGAITIHAQKIPGSIMTVETPLLDVEVTGTVFTVQIIR